MQGSRPFALCEEAQERGHLDASANRSVTLVFGQDERGDRSNAWIKESDVVDTVYGSPPCIEATSKGGKYSETTIVVGPL